VSTATASAAAPVEEAGKASKPLSARVDIRAFVMIGALIVIWILFSVMTGGSFLLVRNISNLVRQMSIVGILGTGMVLVIVSGNIDLSVGSVLGALGGIAAALHIWNNVDPFLTIAVVLVLGMVIGLLQGSIVAYLRVPAFIVTLGGMLLFKGVLLGVTKGISIAPFAQAYRDLGQAYLPVGTGWALGVLGCVALVLFGIRNRLSRRKYGLRIQSIPTFAARVAVLCALILGVVALLNAYQGIPVPVAIMLALVVLLSFIAANTVFGRSIYAMGGNVQATLYSGINVKRNLTVVFMLNGLLAAIAGIVYSARLNAGTPTAGQNMELDAIAAAVIGGASMSGGSGKVSGAILGALFMASIDNGMSMMNMDAYWQYAVKGVILVTAVWFDIYWKK
jgi:D-xylose transport system permease protein